MKKIIKLFFHFTSLTALAVFVFVTNIVEKIPFLSLNEDPEDSAESSDDSGIFPNLAYADIPAGGGDGDDCDDGGGGGDEGDC